jgi:predicted nucleic acid-binding protein
MHVPALCDVEVASALRRLSLSGTLSAERRDQALTDYLDLPLTRHGHQSLLPRVLELGANLSAYDAAYAALAETLMAELVTADDKLRRAIAAHTAVPLVQSAAEAT